MDIKQTIFDICAPHIITQGCRSKSDDNARRPENCLYFTTDSNGKELMCGAAPLLDKEKFKNHPEFERLNSKAIVILWNDYPKLFKEQYQNLNKEVKQFVKSIQQIHDNATTDGDAKKRQMELACLAGKHGLNIRSIWHL